MKRIILFCLLLFIVKAHAQVFGGAGSIWWIKYVWVAGQGTEKYAFKNDTLIQNKPYKNFIGRGMVEGIGIPGTSFYDFTVPPIYVSNDTVAIGEPGNLMVQFAFNANIGDSWVCGPEENCYSGSGNAVPYIVVEDKFDTLINGQTLRALKLRKYNCQPHYTSNLVIEKIGSISNNFLPYNWIVVDSTDIGFYDYNSYFFKCYQSNSMGLIHSPQYDNLAECDELLPVNEQQANLLTTYPNPVNDVLKIDGLKKQPFSYVLYNASGQLLRIEKATGNTIDLSENMPGLYFVRISLANGYTQAVKVVKE